MSAFLLKIIALVTMIFDHVGVVFDIDAFRVVGRVAFPIFVFFIAEGFRHTKSPAKYLARLAAFALISEVLFDLALIGEINFLRQTNIFYTLFLGGAAISVARWLRSRFLLPVSEKNTTPQNFLLQIVSFLPVIFFMLAAKFLSADYGEYGVAFIFLMYAIESKSPRIAVMAVLCAGLHADLILLMLQHKYFHAYAAAIIFATMIPVFLVAFYNGKRGGGGKWFFYVAYPLHLAVLVLVENIL